MKAYTIFTPGYENLGTLPSGRLVWKTEKEVFNYLDFLIKHDYPSNYDVLEIEIKEGWDESTSVSASFIHKGLYCTINFNPILRKVSRKKVTYFELWED